MLATTQSRLSTGKKVNSALDNPTNFFTAASLDSRAGDINNLLDSIGNGVQVLQAANTGITSLQKLVDSAKSVANQALQTTVGFSTKSAFTSVEITGATADNLVAAQDPANAAFVGTAAPQRAAYTNTTLTAGTQLTTAAPVGNATGSSLLSNLALTTAVAAADTLIVNGKTITFASRREWPRRDRQRLYDGCRYHARPFGRARSTPCRAITTANASTATGGVITLNTGTAANLAVTGTALAKLGISNAIPERWRSWRWRRDGWYLGRRHQAERRRRLGSFVVERLCGR